MIYIWRCLRGVVRGTFKNYIWYMPTFSERFYIMKTNLKFIYGECIASIQKLSECELECECGQLSSSPSLPASPSPFSWFSFSSSVSMIFAVFFLGLPLVSEPLPLSSAFLRLDVALLPPSLSESDRTKRFFFSSVILLIVYYYVFLTILLNSNPKYTLVNRGKCIIHPNMGCQCRSFPPLP